jgi:hypothetical protein
MAPASPGGVVAIHRVGELETSEDLVFERRMWRFERIGWLAMLALLIAAATGLLGGSGPLSRDVVSAEGGKLTASYASYARVRAPENVVVQLADMPAGEFRVWIDRDAVEAVEPDTIQPTPSAVEVDADRHVFVFRGGDRPGPRQVRFDFKPTRMGRARTHLGLVGGPEVALRQLVYP